MPTSKAQQLIDDYAGNTWLIERHVEGLSHEESVLQPPFPANCLNWVLGHIISRRNSALELLGVESIAAAPIPSGVRKRRESYRRCCRTWRKRRRALPRRWKRLRRRS